MARTASVAVAGYYPTPIEIIPKIARLFRVEKSHSYTPCVFDPCAGDGEAFCALGALLFPADPEVRYSRGFRATGIELEKSRHAGLKKRLQEVSYVNEAYHGDAFCFEVTGNADVVYLNPPYDLDPVHGRLEEAFLSRFTAQVTEGGVLVFVVPGYALAASAKTLATSYERLACFRFPDPAYAAYKQVVLVARRRASLFAPDPATLATVRYWAEEGENLPTLDEAFAGILSIKPECDGIRATLRETDFVELARKAVPWGATGKRGKTEAAGGIFPDGSMEDLLLRHYPLAVAPKPAHIATGIAAGIFNGARITPDDPESKLPALLVKGCFSKEWKQIDTKKNKDGEEVAAIEVQEPKLIVTVLDLSTSKYHTLRSEPLASGAVTVESMTFGDLLEFYGKNLMRVMLKQCPVLQDPGRPGDNFELPSLARPLFPAQATAARACIRLLGGPGVAPHHRRHKAAWLLGEIGAGKTSTSLTVAKAIQARRTLVLCPPHLLDGWREQIAAVVPEARVTVLNDVADVEAFVRQSTSGPPDIALLTRETAKLGHAYAPVARCGVCGTLAPEGVDTVKKRSTCEGRGAPQPSNLAARVALDLALRLYPHLPATDTAQILVAPAFRQRIAQLADQSPEARGAAWQALRASGALLGPAGRLLGGLFAGDIDPEDFGSPFRALLLASPDPLAVAWSALAIYAWSWAEEPSPYSEHAKLRALAIGLLYLLPRELQADALDALRAIGTDGPERGSGSPWAVFLNGAHFYATGTYLDPHESWLVSQTGWNRGEKGELIYGQIPAGSVSAAGAALRTLAFSTGKWSGRPTCGTPLYQAIPEPTRRVALATYLARRHPRLFDLLILDEAHELAGENSAQQFAAHRLTELGQPVLYLTGTVMNGYASSLFTHLVASSPEFRLEFGRGEMQAYLERYGYFKRQVEMKDKESGAVVAYGAHTDRVERKEKVIGVAPGVLPLLVFKHILCRAVTLHKSDLGIAIPPKTESRTLLAPTPRLAANYELLKTELLKQIKADQFEPERSGKLFGALSELPSYLDLATRDICGDAYEIRYPATHKGGEPGPVVVSVPALPEGEISPKEAWVIAKVKEEIAEGRNVLVFVYHTELVKRIGRILQEHLGIPVPVLEADKVPTKKRIAWIDKEIIAKKRQVMVVNSVTVQTGLNNLVHFSSAIFLENPACNPTVYRQAIGRIDRIGQILPTRVFFPLYEGTLQEGLYRLLLEKVAVSLSTDGHDAESALAAAGIGGGSTLLGLSLGRQIYQMVAA